MALVAPGGWQVEVRLRGVLGEDYVREGGARNLDLVEQPATGDAPGPEGVPEFPGVEALGVL